VRSQRWVAPLLAYVVVVVVSNANHASLMSTYAGTATFLFFAAVWFSFVALGCEDPVQATVTTVTMGSDQTVYATRLFVCEVGGLGLAMFATVWPLVVRSYAPPLHPSQVPEGLVAHAITASFGVSVAAVARALVTRPGWVMLVGCGLGLLEIRVPHMPPVRQVLATFDADHPHAVASSLAATCAETAVISVLLSAAAFLIPRPFR
jgi:hypothetical protein